MFQLGLRAYSSLSTDSCLYESLFRRRPLTSVKEAGFDEEVFACFVGGSWSYDGVISLVETFSASVPDVKHSAFVSKTQVYLAFSLQLLTFSYLERVVNRLWRSSTNIGKVTREVSC